MYLNWAEKETKIFHKVIPYNPAQQNGPNVHTGLLQVTPMACQNENGYLNDTYEK